jgi:molybdopterin converting factor small subunit
MRIRIETLGLPTLAEEIGRRAEVELAGSTVADLVAEIIGRFGPEARRVLVDPDGGLERSIQVMLNEEGFLARDELPLRRLAEGDRVRFMLLVCGG